MVMVFKTTNSVQITVSTEYDVKNSFPSENRFVFSYHITIENQRKESIQILKRKWLIYDVGFGFTEVVGDGVIGLTPEIKPGESFSYFSNVILRSGVGNMSGSYLVFNMLTDRNFEIDIPKFNLMAEVLSN